MLLVSSFFIKRYQAGNLSHNADQSLNISSMQQGSSGLLTPVYNEVALEQKISNIAELAFGEPLMFDRLVTGGLCFRVGKTGIEAPRLNEINSEYVEEVLKLPKLSEQGDGVRSFLGLVLSMMLEKQQIMLFDEPEAFLHPPQATILGEWIGKNAEPLDKQVFLATHDKNILLGLLKSGTELTILRLTRDGEVNHIYQLDNESTKAAWEKPVLRYSNVLQGLFYKQAVICESDGDCRFYNAVLDYVAEQEDRQICAEETLFVPAGGKDAVKSLVAVLTDLHVTVFTILDFDALDQKSRIQDIVDSLKTEWTESIQTSYQQFNDWINATKPLNPEIWDQLKSAGKALVDLGEPSKAVTTLIAELINERVLIVPNGEMECLQKDMGNKKGDSWVMAMLESKQYQNCQPAKDLVAPILASFD